MKLANMETKSNKLMPFSGALSQSLEHYKKKIFVISGKILDPCGKRTLYLADLEAIATSMDSLSDKRCKPNLKKGQARPF